jgi:hypothetical protein
MADDLVLDFGALKMIQGRAFSTPQAPGSPRFGNGSPVEKQWIHLAGRVFLIEQLPWSAVQGLNLPPHAARMSPDAGSIKDTASLFPLRPRVVTAKSPAAPMRIAQASAPTPGLVVDIPWWRVARVLIFPGLV